MDEVTRFNSEPPEGTKENLPEQQAKARLPSSNLYSQQFNQYWTEYKQRIDWITRADNSVWEIEMGEIPLGNSIILFVNLWKDKQIHVTLNDEYHISDTSDELRESWRDMFNRFIKAVNARPIRLQPTPPKVVDATPERQKNLETGTTVYRLAAPKSERIHPSGNGVRKDETGRDGDSKVLPEECQSNSKCSSPSQCSQNCMGGCKGKKHQ